MIKNKNIKKVSVIVGTRPEAIKLAPLIMLLHKNQIHFDTQVIGTGQHTSMLDDALSSFDLRLSVSLDVMRKNQNLSQLSARLLLGLDELFINNKPDLILVHGDTLTAMIGSLVAFYNKIDVGHIEAGLRTHDIYSPFPEEYNRSAISLISKYHFAPTTSAKNNLLSEGKKDNFIYVTGNTVIDALLYTVKKISKSKKLKNKIEHQISHICNQNILSRKYILVTAHRRENWGEGIDNIINSILILSITNPDVFFVFPVHKNPLIMTQVENALKGIKNIILIEPLGYQEFCWLMSHSYLILTDSGGIQEEAPALGKPVLVMRNTSERPEAIEAGTAILVSSHTETIVKKTQELLDDPQQYNAMITTKSPYGEGNSAIKIVNILKNIN